MTHFWLLRGFCTAFRRALWGCWNRVFLPCWQAKAHDVGWTSVLELVWDLGSVSGWLQQCLARGHGAKRSWPLFSSSCACGSVSLGSKDFEVLKWLIFLYMLWQCPSKQCELHGSLQVIAEAFLVFIRFKWLFALQQRKRVLYPGMWAGNTWTMVFHQPVCSQNRDSHWQKS